MFGEEVLYRGAFLDSFICRKKPYWTSALVSSSMFALRHVCQLFVFSPFPVRAAVVYFVFTFGASILFCLSAARTRGWLVPMCAHAINIPLLFVLLRL